MKTLNCNARAYLALVGLGVTLSVGANAEISTHAWAHAAPHAPAPIVENAGGGPVITAPRVVPIVYASDPLLADLKTFYGKLAASTYLPSNLGEYGVGKPTIAAPVVRADAAPAAIDDVTASGWLVDQIAAGALPAEDGNTVYSLVFPSTTQVTAGEVSLYTSFPLCGAISEATYANDGTLVPFTISAMCSGNTNGMSDADYQANSQANALISAFTDPGSWNEPGYNDMSWSGSAWGLVVTSWLNDVCQNHLHETHTVTPTDLGYPMPRIWSNHAAREGHDPCATGSPHAVYFNAAADVGGTASYYSMVKGVILPPGGEVTIPVRLFSDGPTAPWTLGAEERVDMMPDPNGVLSFSFDKTTGKNGDVRQLTIKRAVAADGSVATNLMFGITSTLGTTVHEWIVAVGND